MSLVFRILCCKYTGIEDFQTLSANFCAQKLIVYYLVYLTGS